MMNNPSNAVNMMEAAIDKCHDKKYREQLRQRKRQLELTEIPQKFPI